MRPILAAAILAVGVAVGGWLVGEGFRQGREADRFVTVKGVAERPVEADIAIWPLGVVASGNQLEEAHAQLERSVAAVGAFLEANGIDAGDVHFQGFAVTDNLASPYGSDRPGNRYIINQTLIVRSGAPQTVQRASARVADLVAAGVVLQSGGAYQTAGPAYLFTRLNELKPDMIAQATARAREAAEKFAEDSGATLGGIRRANQGVFQILARDQVASIDEASQLNKIVRVVSTVEYALSD